MNINDVVFKIGDGIGHLFSAALSIDAINNAANGHYQMALAETAFAAYIQYEKYITKKYDPQPLLDNINRNLEEFKYRTKILVEKLDNIDDG